MLPEWLSLVDVVFVAVILLFGWNGFQKGFAKQIAHIITFIILGIFLFYAYPSIHRHLADVLHNVDEIYLMWLIMGIVLVGALAVFLLLCKILANLLKTKISDGSDCAYGLILGLIRGFFVALFAMILLVMFDSSGRIYDKFQAKSRVGRIVCSELVPRIQPRLAPALERNIKEIKLKLLEQEEAGQLEEEEL